MTGVLLVGLAALMHAFRSFSGEGTTFTTGTTLAFGYLLLTAYFVGGYFKVMHLPKLTGYLVTGLLVGPQVLNLVSVPMLDSLQLVTGVAVALLALTAGCELEVHAMRPLLRSIRNVSLVAVGGTAVLISATLLAFSPHIDFMASLTWVQRVAAAVMIGVVMTAQSPAVVVALRNELRAEGLLTRTILGVVVVADLLIIVLFALTSAVAKAVFAGQVDALATAALVSWELIGSLAIGAALGGLVAMYLRHVKSTAELFVLLIAVVIAEVGKRLALDPLLLALAAGIVVRNFSRMGERLLEVIDTAALPVNVLFFAVAGASLHLDAIPVIGPLALLFVLVRGTGLFFGARFGARSAGAPPEVARLVGAGLLPQAGLALALALLIARTFPNLGESVPTLLFTVVAINELGAPVLLRAVLIKSGEAGRREEPAGAPAQAATSH